MAERTRIVRHYTEKEERYIYKNHGSIPLRQIAKNLNRSYDSVRAKSYEMGLRAHNKLAKHAFCYMYSVSGHTYQEIGEMMGMKKSGVRKAVQKFLPYTGDNPVTITLKSRAWSE